MKLLILVGILVPFSLLKQRFTFEFLCILIFLSFPMLWTGWCLPMVHNTSLMLDKVSAILVMLSLWTSILMTLLKPQDKFMNMNILLLLWSLLAFFSVTSLLAFFILFEMSLIPTLCLIIGWGYQPERLEASYYFVFYTIIFSIPLLVSLTWLILSSGSKYFYFNSLDEVSSVLGFLMLCVFVIKLPVFMMHFWLPKAHVEAPVVGSMILAGVLLKTGGYGIMRIFLYMKKTPVSSGFMALGLIGMMYVCLICLYCVDLKQMIAYSSVSHMNFMIVGLMMNSLYSYSGSLVMMVSHGICSSLMFMVADLSYSRCNSRSILINKGILMVVPIISLAWSLAVVFNVGVPPSAGSISELLIIMVTAESLTYKIMFGLYLFLSAFYSVYLYIVVNHGNSKMVAYSLQVKEILLILAHLFPLASLTIMMKLMLI